MGIVIGLQLLLIAMRLDGCMEWSWTMVLAPIIFYFLNPIVIAVLEAFIESFRVFKKDYLGK